MDNGRFFYLAKMLSENNDVEIITSSFRHTTKMHRRKTPDDCFIKVTFIEEPGYPKNVCLKRFQSHYIWGNNLGKYLKNRKKPDVIYCAVPSLSGPCTVAKYCEEENIRFVIDVQDLWPEAFQMVMNIPIISSVMFSPFKTMANSVYRRADAICAVSDTYCRRAQSVNKKTEETATVFLGTELDQFDAYKNGIPVLKKPIREIWLAYCGTLGSSYDLTIVFDAMEILGDSRLRFIIMGDGPRMKEFKSYANRKKVKAEFVGRLKYDAMCCLLATCDITVNPITHRAAQSIINKHADYAASGLPVISTQENEEYKDLIDQYEMGFNCKNNDAEDLAAKLKILIEDEKLRHKMGRNARRCAEERFDRKTSYGLLAAHILNRDGKKGY